MYKLLVAVANYYPIEKKSGSSFVRTRNIFYNDEGIDLTILNFKAKKDYVLDNVNVISLSTYLERQNEFDVLLCHAPNLKNHFLFLCKYSKNFKNIVYVFHGHEVLMTSHVYSKPFKYIAGNLILGKANKFFRDLYDKCKLLIWRHYFVKTVDKSNFVFVSNWMKREFFKWTGINESSINDRTYIIYNTVGRIFEVKNYTTETDKAYDFITIRGNLDGSKYCIDLVNNLAKANPGCSFLVIGRGEFFSHYEKAINLQWIDTHLNHEEIVEYLNKSRCALMPTRTDAQGLMMCEMATFGIPVITSDIPVCHEVLDEFENVAFIDNENQNADLSQIIEKLTDKVSHTKNTKYFAANTVQREVDLINELLQKK